MKDPRFEFNQRVEKEKNMAVTYIDLMRHGNRFGGKMKVEIDGQTFEFDDGEELTCEGREISRKFGENYPEEVTLAHPRGGELRHGQTGDDLLEGSGKYGLKLGEGGWKLRDKKSPVVKDGKVVGGRVGRGMSYKTSGISLDLIKGTKGIINDELNKVVNDLSEKDKEKFKLDAEFRAKCRERAQSEGLQHLMKDEEAVKIAAENEALELVYSLKVSRLGVKGGEIKAIPIVGSGMFAESMFKYALVVEDPKTGEKKVGFDDINEIGGFTKQGTSFRIRASRNMEAGVPSRDLDNIEKDTEFEFSFTDPERQKLFANKKIYLDWTKVRELAQAAKERFLEQKE